MANKKQNNKNELSEQIIRQMLTLATSGFGLVAALAWNNLVQSFVKDYVTKWFTNQSGILSLLIYAVIVTILAVIVTYQLSKILNRLENKKAE